jgi:hypothetical protein
MIRCKLDIRKGSFDATHSLYREWRAELPSHALFAVVPRVGETVDIPRRHAGKGEQLIVRRVYHAAARATGGQGPNPSAPYGDVHPPLVTLCLDPEGGYS